MKEIISYSVISGIFFLIFIIFCTIAIVKKRNWFYVYGITFLFISLTTFSISIYKISSKSYNRVNQSIKTVSNEYDSVASSLRKFSSKFKLRTGEEIYKALFNDTLADCIEIIDYQDQIVPKIDYAIFIHFRTCQDEFKRILKLRSFESKKVFSSDIIDLSHDWFQPNTMRDSIIIFTCIDEFGNGQTLYVKSDSSEVFCEDIYD